MSAPLRRRAPAFEPRFTLGLLYLLGFFWLYCLLWVTPPLLELLGSLPPGAEQDPRSLEAAGALARRSLEGWWLLALAAALATTALLSRLRLLPGTGPRRQD